jgi:methylated-DNA-[protein]-cysteine S-methyltransferase
VAKLPKHLYLDRLATPIGDAMIVAGEDGYLRALDWAEHEGDMLRTLWKQYGEVVPEAGVVPCAIKTRLQDYLDGDISSLCAIEWRTSGTPFQQAVWASLTAITPGETRSYGALATALGCPNAVRAVGQANGANPISVVVPCHRVIGNDGSPTGYGGGIERKRWLLRHEGAVFQDRGREVSGRRSRGSRRNDQGLTHAPAQR